jgi:hypothetical protein
LEKDYEEDGDYDAYDGEEEYEEVEYDYEEEGDYSGSEGG